MDLARFLLPTGYGHSRQESRKDLIDRGSFVSVGFRLLRGIISICIPEMSSPHIVPGPLTAKSLSIPGRLFSNVIS